MANRNQPPKPVVDPRIAYKGYMVRKLAFRDGFWIEAGGIVIQNYTPTLEEAKAIIDTLTATG